MRVRVANLNVWALPRPASRDTAERLTAIGEELARLDVHAAAFQEVWTQDAREILLRAASRAGLDRHWFLSETPRNAGLLVVSKLPVTRADFTPFTLNGLPQRVNHADYYGRKGFVSVTLDAAGTPLVLVDTHLHARYAKDAAHDEYLGHRVAQVVEIAASLRPLRPPVLALGDFNMNEGEAEYDIFEGLSGLRDCAVTLDRRQPTVLGASPYKRSRLFGPKPDQRIDYAFARSGLQVGLRPRHIERIFDAEFPIDGRNATFSDHTGLLVEVELGGPPAPRPPLDREAKALALQLLRFGRRTARERRGWQRVGAAVGGISSVAAFGTLMGRPTSRRSFLQGLLTAVSVNGLLASGALAGLAELFTPGELAGYDFVERTLSQIGN